MCCLIPGSVGDPDSDFELATNVKSNLSPLLTHRQLHLRTHKSTAQVAVDAAAKLLDLVAAGSMPSYDGIRDQLAAAYREGGLTDIANFITAA